MFLMIGGAMARYLAAAFLFVRLASGLDVNPVLLSTWFPGVNGATMDVAVLGNVVFTCNGTNGLTILDATDPGALQVRGTTNTPGFATAIALGENLAIVADGAAGVQFIDVLDPTEPTIIGNYNTAGNCTGIATAGHLAYLADGAAGLQIIDFEDPTNPRFVGNYDTAGTALSVALLGNYAYVSDGTNGVVVIDVSDPANPQRVGGIDQITATQMVIVGSTGYVAADGKFVTLDLSDPINPQVISTFTTPGSVAGISVVGTTAYLTCGIGGLQVVDLADPANPKIEATSNGSTNGVRITVAGRLGLVADQANGLKVFSISNPAAMDVLGRVAIPGNIKDIAVANKVAYVIDGQALRILDVSDPTNMQTIGTYTNFPAATRVAVSGHAAFLMGGVLIQGIDLTDLANPVMKSSIPYGANDMKISGGRLYFAGGGGGVFTSYDFTDTGDITLALSYKINLGPTVLAFQPRKCAVIDTNVFMYGLKAFTGSGVANDILRYDTSGNFIGDLLQDSAITEMDVSDRNLVSVEGALSLRLTDSPNFHATLTAPGLKRLAISSNYVYLAKGRAGVEVATLSGTNLHSLGGAGLPDATAIAVGETNIFVGAGTNGLYALTQYRPPVRLETELSATGTPVIKVLGPINSFGTIQRSADLQTFEDWLSLNLISNPQSIEDTNAAVAFYRFVSP